MALKKSIKNVFVSLWAKLRGRKTFRVVATANKTKEIIGLPCGATILNVTSKQVYIITYELNGMTYRRESDGECDLWW